MTTLPNVQNSNNALVVTSSLESVVPEISMEEYLESLHLVSSYAKKASVTIADVVIISRHMKKLSDTFKTLGNLITHQNKITVESLFELYQDLEVITTLENECDILMDGFEVLLNHREILWAHN